MTSRKSFEEWCKENNRIEILEEWHPTRNNDLEPKSVSYGSEKKIWWRCNKGHEWLASLNSRTSSKVGCPICSGHQVLEGYNDLATVHPEIAREWHPTRNGDLRPQDVTSGSSKKVWWQCSLGHEWRVSVGNRTSQSGGCPYCSNHKVLTGFNDFRTWCINNNRTDLLKEWNFQKNKDLKPENISAKNNRKVWWKDSLGHEWESTIGSRTGNRPSGCPYCSRPPKRILVGFNDLETWCKNNNRVEVLKEWDYSKNSFGPKEVTFGSGKSVWWKCTKNHVWKAEVTDRTVGRTNCPICCRTGTSFPEQAIAFYLSRDFNILQRSRVRGKEVDVLLPEDKIAIEYDGILWHSGYGREKKDLNKTKILKEEGYVVVRLKENSDENDCSFDGMQFLITFIAQNGRYVTSDFEWALNQLYQIINKISKKIIIPKINLAQDEYLIRAYYMNTLKSNSVAKVFPELVKEWDYEKNQGVSPDAFSARINKKVWWICEKGHSWLATINSRGVHKLGCPYCAGQRIIKGKNDFKTWCLNNKPELLKEWDYEKNLILPNELPQTSHEKVWWKCKYGHQWEAGVYNRKNGTGCPICNTGNTSKRKSVSLSEWCKVNHSKLAEEWNYEKNQLTPDEISHGSHKKVWWKCSKGHEWEAQVKSRTYNHGCPFCSPSNKRALVGINDLRSWCEKNNKQYILDEWAYDLNGDNLPENCTFGSHKRIKWRCSKGHVWEAEIKERTKLNGNTCPICRKEDK